MSIMVNLKLVMILKPHCKIPIKELALVSWPQPLQTHMKKKCEVSLPTKVETEWDKSAWSTLKSTAESMGEGLRLIESFNLLCACILSHFSHVQLSLTPRTIAHTGSSVHGILQAKILEWVAMSISRGSS